MSVSKKLRFEVFKRDLFTCQYCGKRPPEVVLEVDHITPVCDGGPDEMDNLTTSCLECNRGKAGNALGNVAPAVDELSRLEAIQEMAERSKLLMQEKAALERQETDIRDAIGCVHVWWYSDLPDTEEMAVAFQDASIRMFLKRGLTLPDFKEAIQSTGVKLDQRYLSGSAAWRYFCGACWTMIRQREGGE